jgi:Spy/CpxP family protein refolding chaperone
MTMTSNLRRITLAGVTALAMVVGAGVAIAQPAGGPAGGPYGPGYGGHHRSGPGGPHGPGAGDQMIGHLIENAKAQLNLNTMQQQMFDAAVANAKTTRESARAAHQKVRAAVQAQLANAEPDLEAIAKIADDAEQQTRDARRKIRTEWLSLYKTFNAEQKAVVRDLLQKRAAHADGFRQKMRERMQQYRSGASG